MLADEGLAEVWCESHDDLTLIWKPSGAAARVEFVQVKSNELDQLWTIPAICQRESVAKVPKTGNAANGAGTSIVEKSFANDRCSEPACFRLVTTRPVKSELEFLTLAREDERRPRARAAIQAVCEDFESRLNQPRSPRGNAIDYWLLNTVWQVAHSEESLRDANLVRLSVLANACGMPIAIDQVAEIYSRLLVKVQDAARRKWTDGPALKRLPRDVLSTWLMKQLTGCVEAVQRTPMARLEEKLRAAGVAVDMRRQAVDYRMQYRMAQLSASYMPKQVWRQLEHQIETALFQSKNDLDSGITSDDGLAFHGKCLALMNQLHAGLAGATPPPATLVFGCMYEFTSRCVHRFRRAAA